MIGGSSFWHNESNETCSLIGISLARIDEVVLVTGGIAGVGEVVGNAFFKERMALAKLCNLFHVLPVGSSPSQHGKTIYAGTTMKERREILGHVSDIYIAVEGGEGTAHEASVALSRGAMVVPVGRSGGFAQELYLHGRPSWCSQMEWQILGAIESTPQEIAKAVSAIIARFGANNTACGSQSPTGSGPSTPSGQEMTRPDNG